MRDPSGKTSRLIVHMKTGTAFVGAIIAVPPLTGYESRVLLHRWRTYG